ncbi:hypothetical protein C1646_675325 [Rhizophagus diaphanus]|nr:hypothetical protein C1646_675325 [Rhizophagus diaphanus] [Rhizophagus sp. MUCL 43196]
MSISLFLKKVLHVLYFVFQKKGIFNISNVLPIRLNIIKTPADIKGKLERCSNPSTIHPFEIRISVIRRINQIDRMTGLRSDHPITTLKLLERIYFEDCWDFLRVEDGYKLLGAILRWKRNKKLLAKFILVSFPLDMDSEVESPDYALLLSDNETESSVELVNKKPKTSRVWAYWDEEIQELKGVLRNRL